MPIQKVPTSAATTQRLTEFPYAPLQEVLKVHSDSQEECPIFYNANVSSIVLSYIPLGDLLTTFEKVALPAVYEIALTRIKNKPVLLRSEFVAAKKTYELHTQKTYSFTAFFLSHCSATQDLRQEIDGSLTPSETSESIEISKTLSMRNRHLQRLNDPNLKGGKLIVPTEANTVT